MATEEHAKKSPDRDPPDVHELAVLEQRMLAERRPDHDAKRGPDQHEMEVMEAGATSIMDNWASDTLAPATRAAVSRKPSRPPPLPRHARRRPRQLGLAVGAAVGALLITVASNVPGPAPLPSAETVVAAVPGCEAPVKKDTPSFSVVPDDAFEIFSPEVAPEMAPIDEAKPTAAPPEPSVPAPTTEPPPPPSAEPLEDEVEEPEPVTEAVAPPFDTAAARQALGVAAANAASCGEGKRSRTRVGVTFAPSGRATTAVIDGATRLAGTMVGSCVAQRMRNVSVPAFTGDPVTVYLTVRVR